jgi:hypothetical protein
MTVEVTAEPENGYMTSSTQPGSSTRCGVALDIQRNHSDSRLSPAPQVVCLGRRLLPAAGAAY